MIGPASLRASAACSLAFLVACAGGPGPDTVEPLLPAGHPVVTAPTLQTDEAPEAGGITGVVRETLEGGGYLYALLDLAEGTRWVAGPPVPLAVGDTVSVPDMVSMGAFESPTLGRSFDELFFTGAFQKHGVVVVRPTPAAAGTFQHEGEVQEAITSGAYVYVSVDTGAEILWIAAPTTKLEPGQRIGWNGGTQMGSFTSPTLGRTFEAILFVQEVTVVG